MTCACTSDPRSRLLCYGLWHFVVQRSCDNTLHKKEQLTGGAAHGDGDDTRRELCGWFLVFGGDTNISVECVAFIITRAVFIA